eukprot:3948224-Alexandrium_andersonii.AAC.1
MPPSNKKQRVPAPMHFHYPECTSAGHDHNTDVCFEWLRGQVWATCTLRGVYASMLRMLEVSSGGGTAIDSESYQDTLSYKCRRETINCTRSAEVDPAVERLA